MHAKHDVGRRVVVDCAVPAQNLRILFSKLAPPILLEVCMHLMGLWV